MSRCLPRWKQTARTIAVAAVLAVTTIGTRAGLVVEKVIVRSTTDVAAPESLVLATIDSREGSEFTAQRLSEDIKRLYRTGNFRQVRAKVEERPGDRVLLIFDVTVKPVVREISFRGNRRLKDKHLRNYVEHGKGALLDQLQLDTDANAIRDRYLKKGFHEVEVDKVILPIPNTNEVNVEFRINEKERYKLKRVEFRHNTVFRDKTLRKALQNRRRWWHVVFRNSYFSESKLPVDEDALYSAYTSKGYFDFEIDRVERRLDEHRRWITLTFHLREGRPYTVRSVSITGTTRFSEDELFELLEQKPGGPYDGQKVQRDLQTLRSKYENLGYLDFRCVPKRLAEARDCTVAINYSVDEGEVCHIRDVNIVGNTITKDHVLRRALDIHPGDLGDASKITSSKQRLENLDYFESVEITPVSTEAPGEKNLLVQVEEQETGKLSLGAGYSTDDDMLAFVRLDWANFDMANWPTFKGGGQHFYFSTSVGADTSDFTMSLSEPWFMDRRVGLKLQVFRKTREEDDYEETRDGAGAVVTWRWLDNWQHSIGFLPQRVTVHNFEDDVSETLLAEEGAYNATRFQFGVARDTRNRYRNPTKGSRMELEVELLSEAFGSYSNIVIADLEVRKYFPLVNGSILKLGFTAGALEVISGDDEAIFDRFFAGGTSSVRGFERREISPIDDATHQVSIGGKSRFTATVEYSYPIAKRIYLCTFSDAGNVWAETGDFNPTELNISVGLGVSLDVPGFPIRIDYGWPIKTQDDYIDDGGEFHLDIGWWF